METLVVDTSVLIDLEHGALLEACFQLPFQLVAPSLLHALELGGPRGAAMAELGLGRRQLDDDGVALALRYWRRHQALSVSDSAALALAKTNGWGLLSGDGALRRRAAAENVACHGVLWLLDRMFEHNAASAGALLAGLRKIEAHPRCRLPQAEIRARLRRYSGA